MREIIETKSKIVIYLILVAEMRTHFLTVDCLILVIELYLGEVFHFDLLGVVDDELVVVESEAAHVVDLSILGRTHGQQSSIKLLVSGGLNPSHSHHGALAVGQLPSVVVRVDQLVGLAERHLADHQ